MTTREEKSFCRICAGFCGVVVTCDERDQIVSIRADRHHPMSAGYACFKGLQAPAMHNGPDRILRPLKRVADRFIEISADDALGEIAAILRRIADRDGADAIGMYRGTGGYNHAAAFQMQRDFMAALGSQSFFSTLTIDQSAKIVTADRLGSWDAGRQDFHDSDVMLVVGGNPIVSMALLGYENFNATKSTKAAKARGMKLIVIDPRRTELATYADIFLQPRAGEDPTIAAGLLRIILREGWHDQSFCEAHVEGVERLKTAVEPFNESYVAARAGISGEDLFAAAVMFARDSKRGIAVTGTGPCMAPHSNLSDHLVEALNVVCGRFLREGESVPNPGILSPQRPFRAEVVPPSRHWENGPQSRIRGKGQIGGEKTTGTLADEILTPGPGQLKALIVDGGNPASGVPDQRRIVEALRSLECLVVIEPHMTNTARVAHFILPPELQYERPAVSNMNITYESAICRRPFQQYTSRISRPPDHSDVLDDAVILWDLARRMNLPLLFDGVGLDMQAPPDHDDLLDILARHGRVSLSELRRYPSGKLFDIDVHVEAGRPAAGRFQVAPPDVVEELRQVLDEALVDDCGERFPYQLISRRMRDTMNSYGLDIGAIRNRHPHNPAYMNSADLAALGLRRGDAIEITSQAGSVRAIAAVDDALRPGVVSMSHCWGGLPDKKGDIGLLGSSTSLLVDPNDAEPINAMPRMSAIRVNLRSASAKA